MLRRFAWRSCLAGVLLLAGPPARGDEAGRQWFALTVEGGTAAIAGAAGLEPGLPAWRVLYEACRRRHGTAMDGTEASDAAEPAPSGPGER